MASIRTRAVRDGDDFVINGQKIWNSGAATADWIYLIARTDPDAPPHAGLSELIVDMRSPGISIAPDPRHDRQRSLLRGVLRGRAGARRQPRRRAERELPPGDAADGARAVSGIAGVKHTPVRVEKAPSPKEAS